LGVDLLAEKTCTFDCVFCEVGRTTDLTLDRKEYVQPGEILAELSSWVQGGGRADHITLAGKGEPTLNIGFGDVIRGIREMSETPVALLSNGSLFFLEDVRRDAALADIVKVSLGAWNQASMDRLNKPYEGLEFDRIVEGYSMFRDIFRGQLWLEVLIVEGINSSVDDVTLIAEAAEGFAPDRIHINTVVRPGAEKGARPVSTDTLETISRLFSPRGEVIADFAGSFAGNCASIREILIRRPCTIEDLANVSRMDREGVQQLLKDRASEWSVVTQDVEGRIYYFIRGSGQQDEL